MKVRRRRTEPTRVGSVKVSTIPFEGISPLVTLDDPEDAPGRAKGAFARLRPPETMLAPETRSWRDDVAGIAIAVRVVPQARRPTGVLRPSALSPRPSEGIREEATILARETGDADVVAMVESILSEVEDGK